MKAILSSGRHHYVARVSIFLIAVALIVGMAGCGSSTPAIEIQDWYGLNATRDSLANNYILMNDLDCTTAGYEELAGPNANEGAGWEPIGRRWMGRMPFTGTFDGQGYEIRDLFMNRPNEYQDMGLFGAVSKLAKTGTIKNVDAVNFTVIGSDRVGGLVGILTLGVVSNSYCTGDITGTEHIGGLVGMNNGGTVSDSCFTGSVTGGNWAGGLVGGNNVEADQIGTVSNCWAIGTVTGTEDIGGLVGMNNGGTVSDSCFTGSVTGGNWAGGLVGDNNNVEAGQIGTVSNCWAMGTVTGGGQVGGLMGSNNGTVTDCYSTGSVTGYGVVGGLVGLGRGASTVTNCYATGSVTSDWWWVGGLVGSDDGTVTNSYATGTVTGSNYVGGLAGTAHTVSNCHATGNVTGDEVIGGLVGWHTGGTISYSYATGSVAGNYSGGLVGVNGENWLSGGLVELNDNSSVAIYYSYSTGSVTGSDCVGGLVGENYLSTVGNSYSSANVTGGSRVGGLVGWNAGDVSDSYATGSVAGGSSVGGLVADNYWGAVSNSFWDTETSGQATSDGGTGKNTAEMQNITTYTDTDTEGLDEPWDITGVANPSTRDPAYIWNIVHTLTYPLLSWQS